MHAKIVGGVAEIGRPHKSRLAFMDPNDRAITALQCIIKHLWTFVLRKNGRVWNPQTGTPWPGTVNPQTGTPWPGTVTKISILDCKTNMFLILSVLGLDYEVLSIHYPAKRKFRSDLQLFFKQIYRFKGYETHRPSILRFFEVFSIMFKKESISLLHRPFKYKNKLYMASWSYNRNIEVLNCTIFIYLLCFKK